jgi:hypothetical protein
MFDRSKFAEEVLLRENIRKAIKIVSRKRKAREAAALAEEQELRNVIRELVAEGQSAVTTTAKHDSTGINALEDLLRNSNLLSVLETGYKSLTTAIEQRVSYKNHILSAIGLALAPEESRKAAGEDVEITEDVEIDITDKPEDDPDFIDVDEDPTAEDEVEEPEVDEKEEFGLEGEDKTGRNRAFTDFHNVEKNILTAFDDLDNPVDMKMFEEYLIKNLALYFEKYENELNTDVEAPPEADAAEAGGPGTASEEPATDLEAGTEDPDDNIAPIELEEVLRHLNLDDIIENLL